MLGWTFITPPFSAPKFAIYLGALAVVTGLSLSPFGNRAVPGAYPWRDDPAAQAPSFDLIRFAKPLDDIEVQWEEIGIPWFLRNAGVVGVVAADQQHRLTISLTWQGKALGRIVEKTEMITPGGTRLYLAFVPDDMALVRQLAAPIDTTLDPVGLIQTTLDEHVRSRLDGESFDLSILKPGSLETMLLHMLHASDALRHPATDNFPASTIDTGAAAIEKAYRDEARLAGADAAK
jgi:hypothetical protein